MKKFLFSIIVFFSIVRAGAQSYYCFKHYQTDDGLSGNTLNCGVQDRRGFIWIGATNGLNRFDGYGVKIFGKDLRDSNSIGNNSIYSLFKSSDGTLWVGTDNGLYRYNESDESFTYLRSASLGVVRCIQQDALGNLWFLSDGRIEKYNINKNQPKFYSKSKNDFSSISVSATDDIWMSDGKGRLYRCDKKKDTLQLEAALGTPGPTRGNAIVKILHLDNERLLVATRSEGAEIYDLKRKVFEPLAISNNDQNEILITDILKDHDDIWFATESGIYIYNLKTRTTVHLKKDSIDPYSLSDNFATFLMKDNENTIWIGTAFGGLNSFSKRYSQFRKFYLPDHSFSPTSNVINYIRQDDQSNIWISTADAGLIKYNPRLQRFSRIYFDKTKESTPSNIPSLLVAGNELWIGTYEYGIYVINIHSGQLLRHYQTRTNPHGLGSNFIVSLYMSTSKDIYVGTAKGLYTFNRASDTFTSIFNDYIECITEDNDKNIWFGTLTKGAAMYNQGNGKITQYRSLSSDPNSLLNGGINTVFRDSKNRLWFGTETGLCKFEGPHRFRRYSLPCSVILSILEDKNGFFWISTKTGLMRWKPDTQSSAQVFTKFDGLPFNQFNYASAFVDKTGMMYFGTLKGLISVDPLVFRTDTFNPPIYITDCKINNTNLKERTNDSQFSKSIIGLDRLVLKHNQSTLSLNFAALSFAVPKTLKYAYKMTGIDDSWVYLDANRTVYYTDLKPGTYTFLVKATNSSGVWTTHPRQLVIVIQPPWWASEVAYLIYFSVSGFGIYLFARNYHRRSQEKVRIKLNQFENEKEREIYQAKIEFFTQITHEIRTPLTLIKGPLENVMKNKEAISAIQGDLALMDKNVDRLLGLTNQLLDFRKVESKNFALNFTRINITDLLTEIRLDFDHTIRSRGLELSLELLPDFFAEVDMDAFRKILNNLFSNAIKYAEKKIFLELSAHNNHFAIKMQNDGSLIPAGLREKIFEPFFRLPEAQKQQGNGIGLALCRSLAELHHGSLTVSDTEAHLNVFVLTLPINQPNSFVLDNQNIANLNDVVANKERKGDGLTVLVVDDNVDIIQFVARILSTQYTVLTAKNGEEALETLNKENIHLVVSDVMMPVMNGFDLCHRIKITLELSHIPVILLTAKNSLQSKIEGLEFGADAYVEKPFSPEYLLAQINSLLKNREKLKLYFANSPLVHLKDIAYSKSDKQFVDKMNSVILEHIAEPTLDVDFLADKMNMSRTTLYRKIKAISNLSPNELITVARLKKSAELLVSDDYKIYEIAYMVGFNSQTYFGQSFQKQFNMTPSEFAQNKRNEIPGKNHSEEIKG